MTDDQMFSSRTDLELASAHARLSREARQLGMKAGPPPQDRRRLIQAVEGLYRQVVEARARGAVPVRAAPLRSELEEQYGRLRGEAVRRGVYIDDMPPVGHVDPRPEHCGELRRRLAALPVNELPLQEMSDAELYKERCELLARAISRGVHTRDLKTTGLLDGTRGAMRRCCKILRERLRRPVASSEAASESPVSGKRDALARIQPEGEKIMDETTAAETTAAAATPSKPRAKKTAAKKPAKAKAKVKAPAKKPAKAKTGGAGGAAKLADDKRIVVKTKENPRREGTGQHKRYETILKYSGKTVAEYLKGKGDRTALTRAHDEGHISVK